ncbi:DUF2269 domain-containing protein [Roseibacterium sp. SDUM158016]|uniref:DUF2269 family protein n=1 Tax=Roseicyclus sediminis TaxID=2980997 RepID=UPI0021D02154|nr:DUF2269 domain-containing protein [Roseibacterium sp. SDUM158016]MCU4653954.1 DUF2269 domain-containing protein [Roseibacterium sp. SDUM158016]
MIDPYLLAKWLHILSATVLFGTGIGTAFQMVWVMWRGDPVQVQGVAAGVVVADWLFTTPAGIVQPATGLWLVWLAGYPLTAPWLVVTYALYAVAFACWVPVVRLQIRIRDLAREAAAAGAPLPPEARAAYRLWFALGWPAFAALLVVFWLMVTRPPLWG